MKPEPNNPEQIAPVRRSKPGEVFYIRIEAMPEPGSDDAAESSGGIFNCYVDADDLRTAEFRAISLVQEQGLLPKRIEAWDLISAESAESKAPGEGIPTERELVEQALVDGACGVVHTWPADE